MDTLSFDAATDLNCAPPAQPQGLPLGYLRDLAGRLERQTHSKRINVKIPTDVLAHNGFVALVAEAAANAGVELEQLEFEITEQDVHWGPDIEPTLRALHALRVRIAVDCFGTERTSLSTLAHLPISTIKLDESIVQAVLADSDIANYARAIIDAARLMRIDVVADGVASEETEAFLVGAGCLMFERQGVTVDHRTSGCEG